MTTDAIDLVLHNVFISRLVIQFHRRSIIGILYLCEHTTTDLLSFLFVCSDYVWCENCIVFSPQSSQSSDICGLGGAFNIVHSLLRHNEVTQC